MKKNISLFISAAAFFLLSSVSAYAAGQAGGMAASALFGEAPENVMVPEPQAPSAVQDRKAAEECAEIIKTGCFYNGAPAGQKVPLLIYYRGWVTETNYPGSGLSGGVITGEANILRSARAAAEFYGLKKLARSRGLAVLVTGSSNIKVGRENIRQLQQATGLTFTDVYAAAHSGGYVGLSGSLGQLDNVKNIVLLDCFYSDFSGAVQDQVQNGSACSGFYTPHNAARYNSYFSGLGCSVDRRTAPEHESGVVPALEKYIR